MKSIAMGKLLFLSFLLALFQSSSTQTVGTCTTGAQFLPHGNACNKFYTCVLSKPQLMECDCGRHFDYKLLACMDTEIAVCYNDIKKDYQPDCPPEGDIYLPNPYDCKTFFHCANGKPVLMECPDGTEFNEVLHLCDLPSNAKCHPQTLPPHSEEPTSTTSSAGTSSSEPTYSETSTKSTTLELSTTEPSTEPELSSTSEVTTEPGLSSTSEDTTPPESEPPSTETSTDQGTSTSETSDIPLSSTSENPDATTNDPNLPQCPPDGISTVPNPEDCTSFYVCIHGDAYRITCPQGNYFNAASEKCEESESGQCHFSTSTIPLETTTQYRPDCPEEGTAFVKNPFDCSSFFVCVNGASALVQCPKGYNFNEETGKCEVDAPCDLSHFQLQGSCSTADEGVSSPNPEDCSSYYVCTGGELVPMHCPPGLWFNIYLHVCDDPSHVECTGSTPDWTTQSRTESSTESTTERNTEPSTESTTERITEPSTESTTERITEPSTESTTERNTESSTEWSTSNTETTTLGNDPNCPAEGTLQLPNPHDCGSFFVCIKGNAALICCPVGYEYSTADQNCIDSHGTCTSKTCSSSDQPTTGTSVSLSTTLSTSTPTELTSSETIPTVDETTSTTQRIDTPSTELSTEQTSGTSTSSPEIKCSSNNSVEYIPNPNDCSSFYVCEFGNPVLEQCPPGLLFNPQTLNCDLPHNVDCDTTESKGSQKFRSNIFKTRY